MDAILERHFENDQNLKETVAARFAKDDVERVARLIKINECKRLSPVEIRVTHLSFGKDWRYPMTSKFRA